MVALAWSIIEMTLDNVVLIEYRVSGQDPRSKPLLDLRFADKLKLQRDLGYLTKQQSAVIEKFQKERNQLFHKGGLYFPNYTDAEKKRLADSAIPAADVAHDLSNRVYGRQGN